MRCIALISDLGSGHHYPALLKGGLLSNLEGYLPIDVSHDIETFNIVEAALTLESCEDKFPEGSIFIVWVHNHDSNGEWLIYPCNKRWYLAPNNGILSLCFPNVPDQLESFDTSVHQVFKQACDLAKVIQMKIEDPQDHSFHLSYVMRKTRIQPIIESKCIRGSIQFVDGYGNVITNISKDLFDRYHRNRPYEIFFKRFHPIQKISKEYRDVGIGESLALFNELGYLEVAINMGNASEMLGIEPGDTIQVDFYEQ